MKIVATVFAVLLAILGVIFVTGSQGMTSRIVIGVVLFAAAAAMIFVSRMRASSTTVVHRVDLPATTQLREFTCKTCGAKLPANALTFGDAGQVTVACPFCNTTYQLEEAPKW